MAQRYQGGILGVGFNPLQAPNAPTIGAASVSSATAVSVAFTPPSNVGGSAISSYAVRVSPGNISASGTSSPITVAGLTTGTAYTFSVSALNSYGPSVYSGTVTATPAIFIEELFAAYAYSGNSSSQTITTNLNLSANGGLVWVKSRSIASSGHLLYDTTRNSTDYLETQSTADVKSYPGRTVAIGSSGFTLGSDTYVNGSGNTFASWSFRKSSGFFDVLTYTGTGVANNRISHSLGATPGFILVKATNAFDDWYVWHRAYNSGNGVANINTTGQFFVDDGSTWGGPYPTYVAPNASTFGVNGNANINGRNYVAYVFAHDPSSSGIIQCGSYTGTGAAGNNVTVGWEPQWVMVRNVSGGDWQIYDTSRGMIANTSNGDFALVANSATNEVDYNGSTGLGAIAPSPTGFTLEGNGAFYNNSGSNYVYVAIRRGPMKTPTSGSSVFTPIFRGGSGASVSTLYTGFAPDFVLTKATSGAYATFWWNAVDRLRGTPMSMFTNNTSVEQSVAGGLTTFGFDTFSIGSNANYNNSSTNYINYAFSRAPGFFDEVCYTGTTAATATISHNLGVTPELMIVRRRNSTEDWMVYSATLGANAFTRLNYDFAANTAYGYWGGVAPTATNFTVSQAAQTFENGGTFIAYLFATCPGVSKVGSYTGNGGSQTINCGFASGARFVMIKRTDDVGDWYVWDSARGIVSGNDPHLSLNTAVAEVTSDDSVDTSSSGFVVNQLSPTFINATGGTYIFLAIS